jgi:uncharacterized OsmC-like protein
MSVNGIVNGVDVQALSQTVEAVRDRRELGEVTFAVNGTWRGGCRLNAETGSLVQGGETDASRSGKFQMSSDEPNALLGSDTAASPGEYVLQALAGCYAVTLAANAAAKGIELSSYKLNLEADFDLAGFLGIDNSRGTGAQEVRVQIELESADASRDQLEDLVRLVEQRSPIRGTLTTPVKVVTTLRGPSE